MGASVASINRSPCPASPSLQFDPNRQCWSTPFCLLPRHSIAFISLFLFLTSYRAFELTQRDEKTQTLTDWNTFVLPCCWMRVCVGHILTGPEFNNELMS